MARPRNPEIAVRNEVIYAKWKAGRSLAALSEEYDRTPQQIGRVIAARHPDLEEDDDRSLHRGRLEHLYEEVQGIFDVPGWKMAPTGTPARGPDGEPAEDVMVKLEAAKLQLSVLESLRKLDARDRPAQQHIKHSHEFYAQQASEHMAALREKVEAERRELEALRAAAAKPVIQGSAETVGRELPPAS